MLRAVTHPLVWLVVLLSGMMVSAARGDEPSGNAEVTVHRTKAGHDFLYAQLRKAKKVAIIVNWPLAWIEQGRAIATPHLGAQLMLNGGAGKRDAATLSADFQDLNAERDLAASADGMIGTLVASPENLIEAASLGRDILTEPHLDNRWLKRLQRNLKADQLKAQQSLSNETWDVVRRFILGKGALNDFLTVRPVSLFDDVTLADIIAWHGATFDTSHIKIAAAGSVEPELAADAIDQLLDGLPSGSENDPSTATAETTSHFIGKTILLRKPDAEQTVVSIAGPMPPTREPGQLLDFFANLVLGGDKQSRLFIAIRTKLRASYALAPVRRIITATSA